MSSPSFSRISLNSQAANAAIKMPAILPLSKALDHWSKRPIGCVFRQGGWSRPPDHVRTGEDDLTPSELDDSLASPSPFEMRRSEIRRMECLLAAFTAIFFTCDNASCVFGSVTIRTPFLNSALALSVSRPPAGGSSDRTSRRSVPIGNNLCCSPRDYSSSRL